MTTGDIKRRINRYLVFPDRKATAWIATFGAALGIGVCYFFAARLGLALRSPPANMAVFWPASGFAAGILISAGRRASVAVVMGVLGGSLVAVLLNHRGLRDAMLLSACNLGEVILFWWLLSRWIAGPFAFRDARGITTFLAAASFAAAISGFAGAAILASAVRPYQVAWPTWLLSHLVGTVVVAPLVIELAHLRRDLPAAKEVLKAMAVLSLLGLASAYLIMQPSGSWLTFSPNAAVLPLLLWLAARFHPAFVVTGGFLVSAAVICATTFNIGWFGNTDLPLAERVHGAQASVATVMVVTLVLVTLFERLRTREEAFRRLLGALPAAIQTTDTVGRITYCNQAAVDLWGKRPALGKDTRHNLYRLYYPDGTPMPDDQQPCQIAMRDRRKAEGGEALLERADGKRIPIIPCPSPIFDELGKFVGVVNMHIDISERKRAEAALAEREAQLALFVEHAPAAIAMFDCEMRYLAVSRRFVVDYRLPSDAQLIGRSHYDIFPDTPRRWREVHARVLAGESLSHEEDQFTRQDGHSDWVRWSMAPWRGADGKVGGALLLCEVRTEQVRARHALAESEARFRATFENAAVGVALVGPDGLLLRVNDRCASMFGYSAHELKAKTFQDITHPDDLEANLSVLKKTLAGEAESYCIEKRYIRKDGGVVWANLTVGCVRKVDGAIDYFISIIEDITDRKRAERRLAERNAQLDLAGNIARIGRFTYDQATDKLQLSPDCAVIYGLPEGTLEISREDWRALVHTDDLPQLDAIAHLGLANSERERVLEFRICRRREVRWIESRVLISHDDAGKPVRIIGAMIDVTERKRAEQALAERNAQFDLAHKAARVGCYTHDLSARTMRFSRASMATHGLSQSTMEITAEQWYARVHRDDMKRLRSEHIRAFKQRRAELVSEFRVVRPGGEARWIEARSLIAYDHLGRAERMTGVYIDVSERRKTEDHKNLLIAELDHRVKNVLACVAAIAQRSRECSKSADEFLDVLNGRITSLANTHALLSRSHWEGVGVGELVRGELAFCAKDESALIEGPEVDLVAEAAQPVAMVLHELATNAAKYGALSSSDGRVLIRWRTPANGRAGGNLVLEWREMGGPTVTMPNATGFGTSVIRDLIPYELGGAVAYELAREGARCRLEIPAKWLGNVRRPRNKLNGAGQELIAGS